MNDFRSGAASPGTHRGRYLLAFAAICVAVFASQTWPYWRHGSLLAGIHADGPFHFYCELSRLAPTHFSTDLAVQSNQSLGAYELFYRSVGWLAQRTGWSLLAANLVANWTANVLYLAGIMVMLKRFGLSPSFGALGTLLAAQPFVLIAMSSGVTHSLAIPREVWLWPMPWLVGWFAVGNRDGRRLMVFYTALGTVFAFTYPLWAVLLGVAFGLADAWRIVQRRPFPDLLWLAGAAVVCAAVVAIPSLATFHATAGADSMVLDYNQISRSVYLSKGLRRFLVLAALGFVGLWRLKVRGIDPAKSWERLRVLFGVTLLVCLVYEPFQRVVPTLSLFYLGRLSLVTFLIGTIAVAASLFDGWPALPRWGKGLVTLVLAAFLVDPARHLYQEWRAQTPPMQSEFVEFCNGVKSQIELSALCLVPPESGSHYFRVYAERGLWINAKDTGVLSRTRELYTKAQERLRILNAFYDPVTSPAERELLLERMRANGLTDLVTRTSAEWGSSLSWPVVFSHGPWQLRTPPQSK